MTRALAPIATAALAHVFLLGCAAKPPTAITAVSPLQVLVRFETGDPAARVQGGPYGLDSVWVTAFEILGGREIPRARAAVPLDLEASDFSVNMRIPYADRYRIAVEVTGTLPQTTYYTLYGTQYYGERVVSPAFDGLQPVAIELDNVVPIPTLESVNGQGIVHWPPTPHALGYTVLTPDYEERVIEPPCRGCEPDTSFNIGGFPCNFAVGFRVRTDLANGFHSAYSEPADYGCGPQRVVLPGGLFAGPAREARRSRSGGHPADPP